MTERLYTPWRRKYVTSGERPEGCVLCNLPKDQTARPGLLYRGRHWYVVLNKYPYTAGHLMVVTLRHVGALGELLEEERAEYASILERAERALVACYQPQGLNLGMNLGEAAGAGIDGHLHWHVLPRWTGDANFVSVVGDTRVLPETVEESYERLLPHFSGEGD